MAHAEIPYDHTNPDHVADKECLAMFSILRDGVEFVGDTAGLKEVTQWQNEMLVKYAYSKQLNTHVKVYKMLLTQQYNEGTWTPSMYETLDCIARI